MMRVFVFEYLSGGGADAGDVALLAPGLSMRDAMVADLLQAGCAVTAASGAAAPAPPAGARPCAARPGEGLVDFVARQAALHDHTWLVAPESQGWLARLQQAVPTGRWLGCDAAAIALASSKRATLARLAAHGLCTPLAFEHAATRWVVKPDDGAGSLDTHVHDSLATARRAHGDGMTLEPWVDGEALSLSLRCCEGRAELLSINRQRIRFAADGRVLYGGVAIAQLPRDGVQGLQLATLARRVVQAVPGLRGFVGIDLVWHATRGPVLIEINPRLTCAYAGLSARLGRNLAADLLADHAQEARHVSA